MKKKKICIYRPFKDLLSKKDISLSQSEYRKKKGVRKILSKQI